MDHGAPTAVECEERVNVLSRKPDFFQFCFHKFRLFANEFNIEHGRSYHEGGKSKAPLM